MGYNTEYSLDVKCTHADTVTLAVLSFYESFDPLSYALWNQEDKEIQLLKSAAEKFGYKLVKKSK